MPDFSPVFDELETSFVTEIQTSPSVFFVPIFTNVLITQPENEEEAEEE